MIATCSILAALLVAADPSARRDNEDPFATAALAPSDVRVFVHVTDAAHLRAELADRPIAGWLDTLLSGGEVQRAWAAMARQSNAAAGELFDRCLGAGFTVLLRSRDAADDKNADNNQPAEWAVLTQLDPDRARELLRPFNPKILRPRHGFALEELPEQELLIARRNGLIVVSPIQRAALLNDVIGSIDDGAVKRLASDPAIEKARLLGRGDIGVFVRHDKPMGGWSAAVADINGDHITLRHAARFDSPPFSTPVTKHDWDLAPIESIKGKAILAVIAPTEAGEGRIESFLHVLLRRPILPAELERFPGQRQILILGEQEGRLLAKRVDMLVPAVSCCVEVGEKKIDRRVFDENMIDLASQIDRLGEGGTHLQIPSIDQIDSKRPGRIDLAPAVRSLTSIPQLAEGVSLNWTDVRGSDSRWWVISSDSGQLTDVALSLASATEQQRNSGQWANGGFVNGRRLAVHVRSWIDRADLLAAPGQVEDFKRSLHLIADLADGFQTCSWRMSRPSAETMELQAELTLSPPEVSRTGRNE